MISILLDPWLVRFTSEDPNDDMNAKMGALRSCHELASRYPLNIVPFLSQEEHASFYREFNISRLKFVADRRIITRWINNLEISDEPSNTPASITDVPCPELSESWLKVLANEGSTNNPPHWRSPMLFKPYDNRSSWPDADEINFTHDGNNKTRNLVPIEHHQDHQFFITDIDPLDPWRLNCVGSPIKLDGSLEQKRDTWQRLPYPPQLAETRTLRDLMERLQDRYTFTREDRDFFYVPSEDWNPLNVSRSTWRNSRTFPSRSVHLGPRSGKSGYRDRGGRIWVWHNEECHWDVQFNGGASYINVSHTGRNLTD